jgi:predicted transcriptional regulator
MKIPLRNDVPPYIVLEGFFILMRKQNVPIRLLFKFEIEDNLDTLRIWVAMKSRYKTGVFYNWTYRSVAKEVGVSPETIRKHLPLLIKEGMAEISGKNLRMVGIEKLKKGKRTCILIPIHKDKSKQIVEFRRAVILNNLHKQDKAINKKSQLVNIAKYNGRFSKSQLKFIQKSGGLEKMLKNIEKDNDCITLSNRGFGRKVHRSRTTGYRLQRKLREFGYIRSYSRRIVVKTNASIYEFVELYANGGYVYNKDTREITRQLSNEIVPMQL